MVDLYSRGSLTGEQVAGVAQQRRDVALRRVRALGSPFNFFHDFGQVSHLQNSNKKTLTVTIERRSTSFQGLRGRANGMSISDVIQYRELELAKSRHNEENNALFKRTLNYH